MLILNPANDFVQVYARAWRVQTHAVVHVSAGHCAMQTGRISHVYLPLMKFNKKEKETF